MSDFKQYKQNTNSLFDKLQTQYSKEIMTNTQRLDQLEIYVNQNRDRMELVNDEFKGFEQRRANILEHLEDVDARLINVEQNKLEEATAIDTFQ